MGKILGFDDAIVQLSFQIMHAFKPSYLLLDACVNEEEPGFQKLYTSIACLYIAAKLQSPID